MTPVVVDPVVQRLSRALLDDVDVCARRMADRIRAQEPLYREGVAVPPEELVRSCADNLRYVFGRLSGDPDVGEESPRETGRRRAERGVPLAALLQAYRIGGRLIWELLVEHAPDDEQDVLLRCAADIWAVSDDLAAAATDAYRSTSADQARRDVQLR